MFLLKKIVALFLYPVALCLGILILGLVLSLGHPEAAPG